MKLVKPSMQWADSFSEGLKEFEDNDISGFWLVGGPIESIEEYVHRAEKYSQGIEIPKRWVPATTYWLIDNDEFIGHINIRHELQGSLHEVGGHIGFHIRPSKHGMGYGSSILKLALPHAKKLGIKKALVTCNKNNIPSRKVIEKNGGKLVDEIVVDGKVVLHFVVAL